MGSEEKCNSDEKEYDLVPPDGGWGYAICLGAIIVFVSTIGFVPCIGMIYKELFEEIGLTSTEISLSNGISAISYAFSGFLTDTLLRIQTKRQLAFIAVVALCCGNGSMMFVNSSVTFFMSTIVQGGSVGLLFNITFSILNEYFDEKRLFAMSLIQAVTGAVTMVLPLLAKWVHEHYGYRGCIILITAVCFKAFIAVFLFHPVEWHMKKAPKKIPTDESHVLLVDDNGVPTIKLNDLEGIEQKTNDNDKSENLPPNDDIKKSGIIQTLDKLFDLKVLKIMITTNMSWCTGFSACVDLTFSILFPLALYDAGWNSDSVALTISLTAFGDLAGRILCTVFSKWITLGSQEMNLIGLLIKLLATTGMMISTNRIVTLVFVTLIGLSRSIMVLFYPLTVSEAVGAEKFTSGMGVLMVLIGVCNLVGSPGFGAIRDYTGSYTLTLWALNGLTGICLVSWSIEVLYKRWNLRKKKTNK